MNALHSNRRRPHAALVPNGALNAVCPYFTMFPLSFPQRRLRRELAYGRKPVVLDVFCGRGTTLYAARAAGLTCYGIDCSPVAVAIARAKLASTTLSSVLDLADNLLESQPRPEVPQGEFWLRAYHPDTLRDIARLRGGLLKAQQSAAVHMLTAIALGALHGPLPKSPENAAYFSNQMPRTYASKPSYSVRYWRAQGLRPPRFDVRTIVKRRVERIFSGALPPRPIGSRVLIGDSRDPKLFRSFHAPDLVITSPPYFGMRTYVPDQWLRNWFLGGPPNVEYAYQQQICIGSAEDFSESLATVWDNIARVGAPTLTIVARFGGIRSRRSNPFSILRQSFIGSSHRWRLTSLRPVDSIAPGRRQADQMCATHDPLSEFDATWVRI
jgi:hypothetical protein